MDEIIQIKCPFDGAVLSVKNQPGIESKNVTCPICKHKYPFTQFKRVTSNVNNNDPDTEYPGGDEHTDYYGEHTSYGCEEKTEIGKQPNYTLGKVSVIGNGVSFQLKPGRNIIGRKGQNSDANFQIDTADKRSMSREHIVIEVKKLPVKGFVHYVSLYKEKVNKTSIGNEPLLYGDCVVLNHGDIIKLPDATLRFEIPDGEETDF
ncbi:FHA domain-containing protein [uncultured Bacteroides sp.]|uniref:FHA domain-containing protein n=1 Tax=uncultured Bacteroides sp. TaxID=162156 RepID=UPI0032209362